MVSNDKHNNHYFVRGSVFYRSDITLILLHTLPHLTIVIQKYLK